MTRACEGCGAPLPPKTWRGPDRKWCSERCRKGQYGGRCANCGARTDGSNGRSRAPELCAACTSFGQTQHERAEAAALRMLDLRRQGLGASEISEVVGMTRESVSRSLRRLRDAGVEVPRDPYFVTSGSADKTPGNQSDPATVGAARGHGNQERGS